MTDSTDMFLQGQVLKLCQNTIETCPFTNPVAGGIKSQFLPFRSYAISSIQTDTLQLIASTSSAMGIQHI